MRSKANTGLILVLLGVFFFAKQMDWIPGELPILAMIGFGFFVLYFSRGGKSNYHNIGVLIPGAILVALGISNWLQQIYPIEGSVALGFAFLSIYLLHTVHFTSTSLGRQHWPLIPAVILLAQGTTRVFHRIDLSDFWPVILIIVGGSMMLQHRKVYKSKEPKEQQDYIDYRNKN